MKKFLLLSVLAATMVANAETQPVKEDANYADFNGLTCDNVWIMSRTQHGSNDFVNTIFAAHNNKIRSEIVVGDQIIFAYSRTKVIDEQSNDYATLLFYDLYTGQFQKMVELTLNGNPITGLLCANQIGLDDFGNVWFTGLNGNCEKNPFKIYRVKDLGTGACEIAATIALPEEEVTGADARRVDYCDLVGDVTGQQARTVFMAPIANDEMNGCTVVGMAREQGEDTWHNHMNDGDYAVAIIGETYPADQTHWNGAPMVRIVRDEECSGNLFYIDAFVTAPALYNTAGEMIDSFSEAPGELIPSAGANGCIEFNIGGDDYFVYTYKDYAQAYVVKFGDGMSFAGMEKAWELPQLGFGEISDSGTRMFGMVPVKRVDSDGNEAIYLSLAKCYNGYGVYRIAQPGFKSAEFETGGVNDITADDTDSNAPVQYFTVTGQNIDNPAAGRIVIKRQGAKVQKMIVR